MIDGKKSGCPVNLTLELLGDRWSLLIIRDMMFGDVRHYREFLLNSIEGISSNILADRLLTLEANGIVTRRQDPSHKQRMIYSLTEQGIELLPVLAQIANWGAKYLPVNQGFAARTKLLAAGGPKMWNAFMEELREHHLGRKPRKRRVTSVSAQLQRAYESAAAGPRRR